MVVVVVSGLLLLMVVVFVATLTSGTYKSTDARGNRYSRARIWKFTRCSWARVRAWRTKWRWEEAKSTSVVWCTRCHIDMMQDVCQVC